MASQSSTLCITKLF